MQIATLTYQYKPEEKHNGDNRAKLQKKHILTTVTNTSKKIKQRQSLHSDLGTYLKDPLPPIKSNDPRRNSIKIRGCSLTSSKLGGRSAYSFNHQVRSSSRQSNKSEKFDTNSQSNTPGGIVRSSSKLAHLKFGYPIKLRSADFYGPDKSENELHSRESSFVNDSIRSAHQNRRASIIPAYNALDDPHLRRFFQSPFILDVVRKTLNIDSNNSFKQDEKPRKLYKTTKRSKSNDSYDYQRIVTKGSSGYAKLNGYDCIPSYSPVRHYQPRSKTVEPGMSSSHRWTTSESRLNHSQTHDKSQASTNTSFTSFPTNASEDKKKKLHKYIKSTTKYSAKQFGPNLTNNESIIVSATS